MRMERIYNKKVVIFTLYTPNKGKYPYDKFIKFPIQPV